MEDGESDPLHARMRAVALAPWAHSKRRDMGDVMDAGEDKGN